MSIGGEIVVLPPIRIDENLVAHWDTEFEHRASSGETLRFQLDIIVPKNKAVEGAVIVQLLRPDGVTFQSFSWSFSSQFLNAPAISTDVVVPPGKHRFKAKVLANKEMTQIQGRWNVVDE